jgi:cytochrome c oxidase subunit 4
MSHQLTHNETHDDVDGHAHGPHVVSLQLLTFIFVALLILTAITVYITVFDFGYTMNLVVAMAVALVKALLVGLYFMHLRWDAPLNGFILVASLLFVTLFITFSLMDTGAYQYTQEAATMARPVSTTP